MRKLNVPLTLRSERPCLRLLKIHTMFCPPRGAKKKVSAHELISTDSTSKYMPNEIVDKVLALKRFVVSQKKECKVIISTLTMQVDSSKNGNAIQKVNEILKKLNIPHVKNVNIVKKHLGNSDLHLNEHGTSRLAMNYIATRRKL